MYVELAHIRLHEGATFTNNGCFMPNGALYVQGNLVNNGKFNDKIVSQDPDRCMFAYSSRATRRC